jgi:hypothetical protein
MGEVMDFLQAGASQLQIENGQNLCYCVNNDKHTKRREMPMSQYTNTFLALPEFESTGAPTIRQGNGME